MDEEKIKIPNPCYCPHPILKNPKEDNGKLLYRCDLCGGLRLGEKKEEKPKKKKEKKDDISNETTN